MAAKAALADAHPQTIYQLLILIFGNIFTNTLNQKGNQSGTPN